MGYIILNTDRDDEMRNIRSNMRRTMMRHQGTMPMMSDNDNMAEHYYKMGYRHAIEDLEEKDDNDEKYRRMRDSRGRYM